jgi:hypothetical protein
MLRLSMAAKKTSPKKPLNKTGFVRSLPSSMPGAEVVKKAKEAGLQISLAYVYSIRAKSKGKPKTANRGPGRPRKPSTLSNGPSAAGNRSPGGLVAEIEAIVERKVHELLKARLGTLFG